MFDRAGLPSPLASVPRVLYHYTSWAGAKGILSSQQFWATAHHCTNDAAELSSADGIVVEVAKKLRDSASGTPAKVLDLFVSQYSKLHITRSMTVCLACFSTARDDKEQWRRYGDHGRGICLGLRVLDESGPQNQSSALLKVDYSEASWRETVCAEFERICTALSRAESSPRNLRPGVSALNRLAAFQSMSAKRGDWAIEQEFRHVTLVPHSATDQLKQRPSADGMKVYLPVLVRASGRRIAFAEILIGPNRTAESTREELEKLLAESGYDCGSGNFRQSPVLRSPVGKWAYSRHPGLWLGKGPGPGSLINRTPDRPAFTCAHGTC